MADLPTGTVTFLFSDIEGSTRIAQERAAAWPELLARHQAIIREVVARHGGVEVGTEGDSFFLAFGSASSAVTAATEIQRALDAEPWPEGAEIRVRIGMHTGEAEVRDGSYVGVAVHRAARVGQAGHGGQVLLSSSTRALVLDALPAGVTLRGLGQHRLRGLEGTEELTQLAIDGLASEFPPIRSLDAAPINLPAQATTFFGRHDEIAEVSELLGSSRLLTLTGPGGTGKTRLSLQVAAAVADRYPDGVFFVPLGPIDQLDLVAPTIAHEVGIPNRGGAHPMERLQDHLRDRQALLVLDNFEQILAAAPAVGDLLAGAPKISILVTSRSPLHIYGEHEYPVPPLAVPDPAHLPPLGALSQFESVALFIDRARAAVPSFAITEDNALAVAEICYRLDGLPLAIELAAARIKLLTPNAILDRLGQRLTLLAGGARDLPARQQTLRGAIEWSYDLLDDGDRRIFAAFAVFVGGTTFEAVEFVCTEPDLDIFECLASLVDKSLIRRSAGADGEARFTMLDTIREYAIERLEEAGRPDELRERHATWYLDLAERAQSPIMGPDKRGWLDRLEEEHGNLRAAHGWAVERGRVEFAMRLVGSLWRFWQMRGYLSEGLDRARAAIAMAGADEHPECLVKALDAAGGLAYWMANGELAAEYYQRAAELQRLLGDKAGEAWALYSLAFTEMYWGTAIEQRFHPDHLARARGHIEDAVKIYREIGDEVGLARALWGEANVVWSLGPAITSEDFAAGLRAGEEALATFRRVNDTFSMAWALYTLALNDIRLDQDERAAEKLAEALHVFTEAGDVSGYVLVLDGIAFLALRAGDRERAARLSGAVAVLEERTGTGLNPPNREVLGFEAAPLRTDADTAAAWSEGAAMTSEAAIEYALEGLPETAPSAEPQATR